MSNDPDSIVIRDPVGRVVLEFYRHSGRRKVYVQSPDVASMSITPELARELAAWIADTLDPSRSA